MVFTGLVLCLLSNPHAFQLCQDRRIRQTRLLMKHVGIIYKRILQSDNPAVRRDPRLFTKRSISSVNGNANVLVAARTRPARATHSTTSSAPQAFGDFVCIRRDSLTRKRKSQPNGDQSRTLTGINDVFSTIDDES
jgi:hypothetical protein